MRKSEDFQVAMRRGARSGNAHVVVYLAPSAIHGSAGTGHSDPPESPALVGFAVSKAVGGAVVRNRVKRRLRHLAAAKVASLEAGSRLVVRALPPSAEASTETLSDALEDAWRRAARRAGQANRAGQAGHAQGGAR